MTEPILCDLILPGGPEAEVELPAMPREGESLNLQVIPGMELGEGALMVVDRVEWVVPAEGIAKPRVFLEWSTGE